MQVIADGAVARSHGEAVWREWAYVREDVPWRQRLYALTLASATRLGAAHHFVLTAQCEEHRRAGVFELADELAESIASCG